MYSAVDPVALVLQVIQDGVYIHERDFTQSRYLTFLGRIQFRDELRSDYLRILTFRLASAQPILNHTPPSQARRSAKELLSIV